MSHAPAGWDVDSPVQAEVFVVWLDRDRLQLTGPDGPQPSDEAADARAG